MSEIDLMAELELADDPCPRGCGRTLDECEDEDNPCEGSPLVRELEREVAELREELTQARADRERTVAVHTDAYAELSRAGAERDKLEVQRLAELNSANASLIRKLAEAQSRAERAEREWRVAEHRMTDMLKVVEAARLFAYGGGGPASRVGPTWQHVKDLIAAVDAYDAAVEHDLDRLRENCRLAEEALKAELERRRIADRERRAGGEDEEHFKVAYSIAAQVARIKGAHTQPAETPGHRDGTPAAPVQPTQERDPS